MVHVRISMTISIVIGLGLLLTDLSRADGPGAAEKRKQSLATIACINKLLPNAAVSANGESFVLSVDETLYFQPRCPDCPGTFKSELLILKDSGRVTIDPTTRELGDPGCGKVVAESGANVNFLVKNGDWGKVCKRGAPNGFQPGQRMGDMRPRPSRLTDECAGSNIIKSIMLTHREAIQAKVVHCGQAIAFAWPSEVRENTPSEKSDGAH